MTQPPPTPQPIAPPPVYGAPPQRTNVLAILALIAAFVMAPAGIVLGVIALNEIKRTGEEGRGLALAGLWVGAVFSGLILLFVILWLVLFLSIFGTIGMIGSTIPTMPT